LIALGVPQIPPQAEPSRKPDDGSFQTQVKPLLSKYCFGCHGEKKKGDLDLRIYGDETTARRDRKVFEKVLKNLQAHEMPPEKKPQPTPEERALITAWIESNVFQSSCDHPDPGRVTIRRLNRVEYNTTIRDLVGVDFQPADDFPADDSGYGFDNIGDVLSLPPVLLEKYLAAAEKILSKAIVTDTRPKPPVEHFEAAGLEGTAPGDSLDGGARSLTREGDVFASVKFPHDGEFILRAKAYGEQAGPEPTKMSFSLDDKEVTRFEVKAEENAPQVYETRVQAKAGTHKFAAAYLNNYVNLQDPNPKNRDRNLIIGYLEVVDTAPEDRPQVKRYPVDLLEVGYNAKQRGDGWVGLNSIEEDDVAVNYPAAEGEYAVRVKAFASQEGPKPVKLTFMVGQQPVKMVEVETNQPAAKIYEARFRLPAEKAHLRAVVRRIKDGLPEEEALKWKTGSEQKGTVFVQWLEVEGPFNPSGSPKVPETHRRIFFVQPTPATKLQAAREIIGGFARRAYRRPVTKNEVDRLMKLFELADKEDETFEGSVKVALQAVLVSPHFLFRGEMQPDPNNPGVVHPIDEYALASRLSYFLWSTMPDDELLAFAERKALRKNLDQQIKRMLKDPKSKALVDNFAGQWLQIRNLKLVTPDPWQFPEFDDELRAAMQRETELFFEAILREDRSVLEFLDANYTFVNERLARHYGIPDVKGDQFQRVTLRGNQRGGLLTQAGILTITSNPTRTSPVKRGKWVLENLLGTPPPPPPPDVPDLKEGKEVVLTGTLRQRMEQHRQDPTCAACHARMDPIGFGLENFNGIGGWRDKDGTFPIEPSGKLVSGETFSGAADLKTILLKKKRDDFVRCLSEKMLTYALGRGLEYYDKCAVEQITKRLAKSKYRFSALMLEVIKSTPFQMQRGEEQQLTQASP
jgi:hypothetical protein